MKAVIDMYRDWRNGSARQFLPKGYMQHMPSRVVGRAELYELMCELDFNPTHHYPKGLRKRKNEVGHNQMYRLLLDEADNGV